MPAMTGGSDDDARTSDDEQAKVDSAWDALIDDPEHHDHRKGSGGHAVVGNDRSADPDEEMDRLMLGAAELPETTDDDDDSPKSDSSKSDADDVAEPSSAGPALRVVAEADDDPPPRASRPVETPSATPPPTTIPWAWIAVGTIAVGVLVALSLRDDGPSSTSTDASSARHAGADPSNPTEIAEPSRTSIGSEPTPELSETSSGTDEGPAASTDEAGAPATPPSSDPREPPPGTSPEAAAAFVRLPVSPSDRPPVGGIGASGIHVDHIAMGSRVEGGTCLGQNNGFSVERREHVSVCIRVVHQRQKEELQVLWKHHGGSTRRSKMVVQPRHAYRTRGYLKLRKEYIGDWTVRILSSDDVELARHDFTIAR